MSPADDPAHQHQHGRRSIARRRTDEELRRQKDVLQKIFDHIPVIVCLVDAEGRVTLINREGERRLGWSLEEIQRLDIYAVTYPDPHERLKVREFMSAADGEWGEFRPTTRDGRRIDTSWTVVRLSDGTLLAIGEDLTARKRADHALRERNQFIRSLIELTPVVVDVFDLQTARHTYFSSDVGALFGYSAAEITQLPDPITTFVHPDDIPGVVENIARLKRLGDREIQESEVRVRRRDGQWRWVASRSSVLTRDDDGEARQVVTATVDVTARKEVQEALQLANDELEQRDLERTAALTETNARLQQEMLERTRIEDDRGRLLRRIVLVQEGERRRIARDLHDQVGQQLTTLILGLGILKSRCPEDTDLSNGIAALETDAKQLDFEIDALVRDLRPAALDDFGLVAALTKHAASWSQHRNVLVGLHVSGMERERLGAETETTLYRIAQEALHNIAKHAHADHVDIILERHRDHVSLIIEDNGVGFEATEASDRTDKGLGLIGMRERAALVHGTVVIESRPGHGTTVFARVPAPAIVDSGVPS